jgi:hypothetical protein
MKRNLFLIIQACTLQGAVVHAETRHPDDMQMCVRRGAEARDIARIWGYFGFEQYDVKHRARILSDFTVNLQTVQADFAICFELRLWLPKVCPTISNRRIYASFRPRDSSIYGGERVCGDAAACGACATIRLCPRFN